MMGRLPGFRILVAILGAGVTAGWAGPPAGTAPPVPCRAAWGVKLSIQEKAAYTHSSACGAIYPYPGSQSVTLDPRDLGYCMARIARDTTRGSYYLNRAEVQVVTLQSGGVKRQGMGFARYLQGDELRDRDFTTSHVDELERWVLSRPDASVDHLQIFEASLRLHKGNLWAALVAIHQLLRNEARWFDWPRYQFKSSRERQGRFFAKFVDARGDLRERGPDFQGDHAGSWYRVWAGMLLRLAFMDPAHFQSTRGPQFRRAECAQDDWLGKLLGKGSSLVEDLASGSLSGMVSAAAQADGAWNELLGRENDARKAEINGSGSNAIGAMLDALKHPELIAGPRYSAQSCRKAFYLRRTP